MPADVERVVHIIDVVRLPGVRSRLELVFVLNSPAISLPTIRLRKTYIIMTQYHTIQPTGGFKENIFTNILACHFRLNYISLDTNC